MLILAPPFVCRLTTSAPATEHAVDAHDPELRSLPACSHGTWW
jgi:hypothetical protein